MFFTHVRYTPFPYGDGEEKRPEKPRPADSFQSRQHQKNKANCVKETLFNMQFHDDMKNVLTSITFSIVFSSFLNDYDNLDDQVPALYEGFAQFVAWCYLKDMDADLNKKVPTPIWPESFPAG